VATHTFKVPTGYRTGYAYGVHGRTSSHITRRYDRRHANGVRGARVRQGDTVAGDGPTVADTLQ